LRTPLIYISGIYRSGTTLLARLLNAEAKIASASDPIRPFFNGYRSRLEYELKGEVTSKYFRPLNDYYKGNQNYLEKLVASNFSENIEFKDPYLLRREIYEAAMPFSKSFAEALRKEKRSVGIKWVDELNLYLRIIHSVYGSQDTKVIAFKEVWAIEMAFPLFNLYGKNMNLVSVIRDPRSILASSIKAAGNYPIVYLARQWRKHIMFSYFLKQMFPKNVHLVYYEDLCKRPKEVYLETFSPIMSNVGENITNIPKAKSEEGKLWKQNSSFSTSTTGEIVPNSLDSWRDTLNEDEIDWITYLTYQNFEKKYIQTASHPTNPYPRRSPEQVSDWMRVFLNHYEGEKNIQTILQDEKMRAESILNSENASTISLSSLINHV